MRLGATPRAPRDKVIKTAYDIEVVMDELNRAIITLFDCRLQRSSRVANGIII